MMKLKSGQLTKITFSHADKLIRDGLVYVAMKNGSWWKIRSNGQTKHWKRDASRIAIPFKFGLKGYGKITETDFRDDGNTIYLNPDQFRHIDDLE